MIIVVEFGLISEIIIFEISYIRDIDFWSGNLRTPKIFLCLVVSKILYFDVQRRGIKKPFMMIPLKIQVEII